MDVELFALGVEAQDPRRLAAYWSGLLGWEHYEETDDLDVSILPTDDTGFRIRFIGTTEPKSSKNEMHLDLTSTSPEDQARTVARALELGGRHADVGQGPEDPHVVLADPEGNELCVIEPGNGFLAGCGFVGALACDGSPEVAHFWSAALGWPLVWDRDGETAVQAAYGGPKISWGGEEPTPATTPRRLHLELVTSPRSDLEAVSERLVALGATRLGGGHVGGPSGGLGLADPDGNPFCLLPTR